jgi:hypothetical protein
MDLPGLLEKVKGKLSPTEKHLAEGYLVEAAVMRLAVRGARPGSDDKYHRQLVEELREMDRKTRSEELALEATDKLFGKALVRSLAPRLEELRRSGFDSPEPPFKTVAEAAAWVEQTADVNLAEWRKDSKERKKARAEIERLAAKYRIEIQEKATQIPYQKPSDEQVKWTHAVPGTFLLALAQETRRIAEHTGLPQDALVTYVLTGIEPARSRVRLTMKENRYTLPSGEQIGVNEALVTLRARDLTDKELRTIYRMARGHVGGKGTKGLRDDDVDLWELVQDLGGPPQEYGSKGQFWETVREHWNREYPDEPYTTRNGVKRRYERISARLQPPRKRQSTSRRASSALS